MNVPIQAKPVARMVVSHSRDRDEAGFANMSQVSSNGGITPCEAGIDPSFGWDDVLSIATKALPIVLSAI